tara:strand:+ start:8616 stop:10112 length:1497 start_codon:yes stop_codon:yes gene_type:complete
MFGMSMSIPSVIFVVAAIVFTAAAQSQSPVEQKTFRVVDATGLLLTRGTELSDQELQLICTATDLRELNLAGCSRLTNAGFSSIFRLKELESLNLSRCHRLTDAVFEDVAKLKNLNCLDISSTKFNVPEVAAWLKMMPNLKELYLREATNPKTKGLGELTGLTHLDISCERGRITDADLAPLATLTTLKYLNANGSRNYHANVGLSNAGLKHLEGMTSLEFLGLFGHFKVDAKGYNPLFAKLKRLKKLDLGFNWPLKGEEIEIPISVVHLDLKESFQLRDDAIINLKNKSALRTLNLFYCLELTDKSLESLRDLPQLEYMNLGCIGAMTNEGLKNLEANTGLTYLNLGDNDNFSDAGLVSLKRMVALKELNLWSIPNLKGEGLEVLQSLPNLQTLNLADCSNLTDEALRNVGRWSKIKNLYLDNCTKISDDGIGRLARLSDLRELTLRGCLGITDKGLASIGKLKSLQYIVLSNCPGLTSGGIAELEQSLPNCEIVRD